METKGIKSKTTDKIIIFDTSLRDGEQTPGVDYSPEDKLEIAQELEGLGVDVIEAGFPFASKNEVAAVTKIAKVIKKATVCALAKCDRKDIDVAWDCIRHAKKPRLHVFLATSDIHLKDKLRLTQQEAITQIRDHVRYAVQKFINAEKIVDVEFSPEDATRTEYSFLIEAVQTAIESGATTINIPDTVGYATPQDITSIMQAMEQVQGIENVIISIHCHNDLGMATANSIAAIESGAKQIECTINGLGERAGNAATEEVVMAIKTRGDHFHATTNIDTEKLGPMSREIEMRSGIETQPNKAIVGRNAFAHESGIHQDGVGKNASTYEIMTPESVGWKGQRAPLGKLSGMSGAAERFKQCGLPYNPKDKQVFRKRFNALVNNMPINKKYIDTDTLLRQVYYPTVLEITEVSTTKKHPFSPILVLVA